MNATDGTVVMVIRHGEKPTSGQSGMDDSGRPDSKSLTARGWERAHALPKLFSPPRAGLARPAAVFAAADQGPNAGAHRMRQTVTPLAKSLGLTVDTSFAEGSERRLAQAALNAPGPVLICWEHSRIPAIVAGLGAADAPGTAGHLAGPLRPRVGIPPPVRILVVHAGRPASAAGRPVTDKSRNGVRPMSRDVDRDGIFSVNEMIETTLEYSTSTDSQANGNDLLGRTRHTKP
ncbi:hypothetical protein ACQ4WX_03550 [Streptomyces lasalocidi]